MAMISYIETIRDSINAVPEVQGQLIYCTDTMETFYDTSDGVRVQMGDIVYVATEAEREALLAPT